MRIYRHGILIWESDKVKSVFNYDLPAAEINELRQYTGYREYDISCIIPKLNKQCVEMLVQMVKDDNQLFETELNYATWSTRDFGEGWIEAFGDAKVISKRDFQNLSERGLINEENAPSMIQLPDTLAQTLLQHIPGLSALRSADKVNSFCETVNDELTMKIKSAMAILESCGYTIPHDLNFIVGVFGNQGVMAKIKIDEKVIMYSEELLKKSMFDIVTTVVEECEHYATAYTDMTREFQQHFIDLYVKELLKKNDVQL